MAQDGYQDFCQCCSCRDSSFLGSFKRSVITLTVLAPIGLALHFWIKKNRLSKYLSEMQGKCTTVYHMLNNDTDIPRQTFEQKSLIPSPVMNSITNTTDFIQRRLSEYLFTNEEQQPLKPDPVSLVGTLGAIRAGCDVEPAKSSDDVGIIKRLEQAVYNLTRGMKITNKRLLQLSEQVLYLRQKLEDQSQIYSQSCP